MSNTDLTTRPSDAVARLTARQVETRLGLVVYQEQAAIEAISLVAEFAASEAVYLKSIPRVMDSSDPETVAAVAAIVSVTVAGITRRVGRFANGVA